MTQARARAGAFIVAIVALCGARDLGGQQTPARVISGIVEVEDNGRRVPVRRAAVTLTSETAKVSQHTYTDNEGRFAFSTASSGRLGVQAKKAGFLQLKELFVSEAGAVAIDMQRAAVLEGRFIESTGKAIPDLTVSAESISQRGTFTAKTDDRGRFRIHTIPGGQYRIFATPPAPASGEKHFYPGTEDIAQAGIVTVIAGQTADGLTTVVPVTQPPAVAAEAMATQELQALGAPPGGGAWGQISGRVTSSDSGQPIAGAEVRLTSGGVLIRKTWSDGDGGYTFTHVVPGTLFVAASADGHMSLEAAPGGVVGSARVPVENGEKAKRDLVLVPLGGIEGRVIDEFSDGVPDVVVRVTQKLPAGEDPPRFPASRTASVTTDDRGWYRASGLAPGEYYVVVVPRPFAPSNTAPFPITYFPGTQTSAAATPIRLSSGIDAHGVNLTLPVVRSTTLLGLALDSAGRPQTTTVELTPVEEGPLRTPPRVVEISNESGRFTFRDIPEGSYTLRSRGLEMMDTTVVTVTADVGPEMPVRIHLKALGSIRGRVTFEGGSPPADRVRGLMVVRLQSADSTSGFACGSPGIGMVTTGQVQQDLTFHVRNIACPGVVRMGGAEPGSAAGWTLARVLHQGRDITDTPMDFQSGDFDGVEIVFTQRVGAVSGTVVGVESQGDIAVVIAGADSDSAAYFSRTLRISTVANKTGEFSFDRLLPGRYYVIAVRRQYMPLNPLAFSALRTTSTLVTVTEGTDSKLSLTIVK